MTVERFNSLSRRARLARSRALDGMGGRGRKISVVSPATALCLCIVRLPEISKRAGWRAELDASEKSRAAQRVDLSRRNSPGEAPEDAHAGGSPNLARYHGCPAA